MNFSYVFMETADRDRCMLRVFESAPGEAAVFVSGELLMMAGDEG